MEDKKDERLISRRKFMPLAGAGIFIPIVGQSAPKVQEQPTEDEEYATLLNADGKAVKVKRSALKKAKVVKKNMSNKSLLSWLKPKLGIKS